MSLQKNELENFKTFDESSSLCKCRKKCKIFNCAKCTIDYPILVRRSVDELESHGHILSIDHDDDDDQTIKKLKTPKNLTNRISPLAQTDSSCSVSLSSSSSSISSANVLLNSAVPMSINSLVLKPSPIPVSSTLISLLNLNRPNNSFIPPPNMNIALFQHAKK